MIASAFRQAFLWLGRNRQPQLLVPAWLEARRTSLGIIARKGGPGSDLAAAELKGITTTILAVCKAARVVTIDELRGRP